MEAKRPVPAQITERPPAPANWARAGLKLVPYVGTALDELVFGRMDEIRWKRVEQTLRELGEMMEKRQVLPSEACKEDFGRLLEVVAPEVSRAGSEQKRILLRNLLINAVRLPVGDPQWESARLAAQLVADQEVPALAILAALSTLGARETAKAELRAADGGRSAEVILTEPQGASISLTYDWLVVEQCYRRLSAAPNRLVIAGAHGHEKYEHLALTALGEFVITWATADQEAPRL